MKRTYIILLTVFTVAVAGTAWWHLRTADRPNVLILTLDTTRADHLGCYGYADALTPTLDKLAAGGTLFEQAVSCVPLTLPSHATMFTGLLPPEHGLRTNGENSLDPAIPLMAESFRAAGYSTAAIIASFVLDSRFGLARGFDTYEDYIKTPDPEYQGLRAYRPGKEVVDLAIDWLAQHRDTPFFCWVHLFDPHKPYHAHENLFGNRYAEMPYDAEVAYMDRQVARLFHWLRANGQWENTLVVAVGDHGEGLGDHGELYHGIFLYESTLHVPLIFSWPGRVPAGRRITQRVSLVDLYPSILRLAGCEGAQTPFAEDLSATIRGHRSFAPRECYAETEEPWWQYGWSPLTALIADDWKYIRAPEQELYNLAQDPKELTNRVTVFPGRLSDLSYGLDRLEEAVETHAVSGVSLSDEDARVLQSLGYGGGGSPPPRRDAARQLPDPKQMVPLLNKAMYAKSLLNDGRVRQALDLLKEAIAPDPNNVGFMFLYAQALEKAGYLEEAAVVLGKILHHGGYKVTRVTMLDSMTLLAKCLYGMGKTDAAARYMQDALTLDPESIVAMNGLAWIWATYPDATEQQRQQAVTLAEDAVDRTDHAHPSYLDTLSVSYAAAGQFGDALEAAQQALDLAMAQENHKLADDIRGRMRQFSKRRMPSTSVQGP